MRIPPSNIGWQSTAVIRWAIFCDVGKYTFSFVASASENFSTDSFFQNSLLSDVSTWKVSELNFSMILALPCIRDYCKILFESRYYNFSEVRDSKT